MAHARTAEIHRHGARHSSPGLLQIECLTTDNQYGSCQGKMGKIYARR